MIFVVTNKNPCLCLLILVYCSASFSLSSPIAVLLLMFIIPLRWVVYHCLFSYSTKSHYVNVYVSLSLHQALSAVADHLLVILMVSLQSIQLSIFFSIKFQKNLTYNMKVKQSTLWLLDGSSCRVATALSW